MSCAFCRSTPVDPCPVCAPADHAGNTRIRRAPKLPKALRNLAAAPAPGVNSRARYTPPPGMVRAAVPTHVPGAAVAIPKFITVGQAIEAGGDGSRRIAANEQRIRELEARLAASKAAGVASVATVPPTRANPTPPPPIFAQRPAQAARVAKVTPISNWEELGNLAREWMRSKRRPQLVDSTAKVVPTRDEEATHPPITRGDFRGLWVAVESGHLSEQDAIEIASSWRTLGMELRPAPARLLVSWDNAGARIVERDQFLIDNAGDAFTCAAVLALKPGDPPLMLGGGASPELVIALMPEPKP